MTADASRAVDDRINRPFVGIPSFLRAPILSAPNDCAAAVAVMGMPFDEGSPYLPGARLGPRAIREHSLRFVSGDGTGYYRPETRKGYLDFELSNDLIVDAGDVDVAPTNVERTFGRATEMTRQLRDRGALVVVLGGDHSITYPIVRGFTENLHVIQFDAHLDYSPFSQGLRFTNAHAFRHIRRMDCVTSLTQVGIRGLRHSADVVEAALQDGNRIVTMSEFRGLTPEGLASFVPKDAACYVSVDVDVLDMSLVPGCVSAEPDGMSYAELRDSLKAIAEHVTVVGFDLVEVNPQLDVGTGATSYLGAHTIVEFLGHICDQPSWVERRAKFLRP